MARGQFGAAIADFATSAAHGPTLLGGTVWTAQTGGTQVTDLRDMDGDPMTSLGAEAFRTGFVQFQGPDNGATVLWVECGAPSRIKLAADPDVAFARVVDEISPGVYPDRPEGAFRVIWFGTTTPAAALDKDIYVNTGA